MKFAILLFEDFETLDAMGPAEVFGFVEGGQLAFVSVGGGLVRSAQGVEVHTEKVAEADFNILILPGGIGTRTLVEDTSFIESIRKLATDTQWVLSVCTGSALLAKAGVLDDYSATSNKRAMEWVKQQSEAVEWVHKARWVEDGNIWTSSGISAGIDMALAFVARRTDRETAKEIADRMEYRWNESADDDPFATE